MTTKSNHSIIASERRLKMKIYLSRPGYHLYPVANYQTLVTIWTGSTWSQTRTPERLLWFRKQHAYNIYHILIQSYITRNLCSIVSETLFGSVGVKSKKSKSLHSPANGKWFFFGKCSRSIWYRAVERGRCHEFSDRSLYRPCGWHLQFWILRNEIGLRLRKSFHSSSSERRVYSYVLRYCYAKLLVCNRYRRLTSTESWRSNKII